MANHCNEYRYKDFPPEKHRLLSAILNYGGNVNKFSKSLGIHPQKVFTWLSQDYPAPPPQYCKLIEELTLGEVTREQLRPDIFGKSKIKPLTYEDKFNKCIGILHDLAAEIGVQITEKGVK